VNLQKQNIGPKRWKAYCTKNGGCRKFQIDLGIALLNYAIGLEWDGKDDSPRPRWMRQTEFVPCDCNVCFFCLHGFTDGVHHERKRQKVTVEYACGSRMRTNKCTTDRCSITLQNGDIMVNAQHCRMCFRMQTDKSLPRDERKAACGRSI
jgi:hypothetical protein